MFSYDVVLNLMEETNTTSDSSLLGNAIFLLSSLAALTQVYQSTISCKIQHYLPYYICCEVCLFNLGLHHFQQSFSHIPTVSE